MSLNNIKLNPSLLSTLYKNVLVETGETPIGEKKAPVEPIKIDREPEKRPFLGENKKKILLLVRYEQEPFIPDAQLTFLTSVLAACKLGLADVAILNSGSGNGHQYNSLLEKFNSQVVILFGITPAEFGMPLNFPEFQVQAFNNCTFLYAPVLEALEKDKILKSKLWVSLRKIFQV